MGDKSSVHVAGGPAGVPAASPTDSSDQIRSRGPNRQVMKPPAKRRRRDGTSAREVTARLSTMNQRRNVTVCSKCDIVVADDRLSYKCRQTSERRAGRVYSGPPLF